ncbi:MAG: hypothetical protein NVSMB2_08520 [Chloroflexota bacterium]
MSAVQPRPRPRDDGIAGDVPERSSLSARSLLVVPIAVLFLLPLVSWLTGIYERVTHWGKFVHVAEGLAFGFLIALLLLGWRDRERIDITDELAGLVTICAGILFGVGWKIVEFVQDWAAYADVEKSNSDTMTDFLWNDFGTVIGALLAVHVYCSVLRGRERDTIGAVAHWLAHGPSRVLDRHGVAVTAVVAVGAVAAVMAVWFASRPLPGLGVS